MSFRINTNVDALSAYYALAKTNKEASVAQLRIATGKRVNSVADDTSGFQIGKSLEGKISTMKAAQSNVSGAKNLLATAEGSLMSVSDLLVKIEGKLSDATNPTADRASIADDIKSLAQELKSVLASTKFNNTSLLTGGGDAEAGFIFQVGNAYTDKMTLDFAAAIATSEATGFNTAINTLANLSAASVTTSATMTTLQANLSTLKSSVTDALGKIGNYVQRLDIREETLNIAITNAQSSVSRLFDTDAAMEQLNATRGSILGQAATSMLSQLNQNPQQVLSLFK
ncbi:MAG: flagellar biosynthesis protein FliC [Ignavibacteriales bacterium]|nr:flagellar biosynthesis protein FliC [Ignavibacteriales bacterium]